MTVPSYLWRELDKVDKVGSPLLLSNGLECNLTARKSIKKLEQKLIYIPSAWNKGWSILISRTWDSAYLLLLLLLLHKYLFPECIDVQDWVWRNRTLERWVLSWWQSPIFLSEVLYLTALRAEKKYDRERRWQVSRPSQGWLSVDTEVRRRLEITLYNKNFQCRIKVNNFRTRSKFSLELFISDNVLVINHRTSKSFWEVKWVSR